MNVISNLQPECVWKHFEKICSIPHPSHHETQILAYLLEFAKTQNLKTYQDSAGNIIVTKNAHKGFESCETIALQAHVDMVPQKNHNIEHDFTRDPIKPYALEGWVSAENTSLGADNGIGLACILAILESDTITHGPIEALFTVSEETGMTGAYALETEKLEARYMINTDTEDEHDITIGCAGGIDGNFICPIKHESCPKDALSFIIEIQGLTGGHSGFEIMYERANAAKLICELLSVLCLNHSASLAHIEAGNMRNAIPRNARAHIVCSLAQKEKIVSYIQSFAQTIAKRFSETDCNISCTATEHELPKKIISTQSTHSFLQAVSSCPNGVISFEKEINTVRTSTNLSIIQTHNKDIEINCLLRSSNTQEKTELALVMQHIFNIFSIEAHFEGDYPAWEPQADSKIASLVQKAYDKCTDTKPTLQVVHAGLECGIIQKKYPNIEYISIGPNIRGPHSPDEKVEIRSVAQFWNILLYILEHSPKAS
ncbi:MAG: aminoacyl-histidine dipeptidase [Bacteroidales bacterium]|jgi:dipeptidase D|nr:aminoacyl-histidine dipeptidase [Bacteroidales bacterium]